MNSLSVPFEPEDPFKKLREAMKALDPLREYREAMKAFDPLKEYREAMKAVESMAKFEKAFGVINTEVMTEVSRLFDSISRLNLAPLYEGAKAEFTVNDDGSVAAPSHTIDSEEFREISHAAFNTANARPSETAADVVERLIEAIQSAKDPLHKQILAWIIFPIIVGLILSVVNPIADYYVKDFLERNKRSEKKQIVETARLSGSDQEIFKQYRFVGTKKLEVRLNGAMKSQVIGILSFGQTVEVIEKNKSWTLVQWIDRENNVQVQGWVLSRYLEKFR